ncbi:MAG: serine/threonine protein kinase, partial [Planctomycetota bacterium]
MIKLEVGEKIGEYRVLEFIARGGFSLVYLAEDKDG